MQMLIGYQLAPTCSQVLLCIRQGLFEAFRDERGRRATAYANDCDEDVCLSWFLLQNPQVSRLPSHTRLNRLVQAVDLLDTTAGASLHPLDRALMSELAWIFEPYRQARVRARSIRRSQICNATSSLLFHTAFTCT